MVKADFERHLAEVQEKVRRNGGQILGEEKAAYVLEPATADEASIAASYPSGCGCT